MASMQASFTGSGTSKSGWPIEKLIGSFIFAARSKTLRMPLESKARVRSARRGMGAEVRSQKSEGRSHRSGVLADRMINLTQRHGDTGTPRLQGRYWATLKL